MEVNREPTISIQIPTPRVDDNKMTYKRGVSLILGVVIISMALLCMICFIVLQSPFLNSSDGIDIANFILSLIIPGIFNLFFITTGISAVYTSKRTSKATVTWMSVLSSVSTVLALLFFVVVVMISKDITQHRYVTLFYTIMASLLLVMACTLYLAIVSCKSICCKPNMATAVVYATGQADQLQQGTPTRRTHVHHGGSYYGQPRPVSVPLSPIAEDTSLPDYTSHTTDYHQQNNTTMADITYMGADEDDEDAARRMRQQHNCSIDCIGEGRTEKFI